MTETIGYLWLFVAFCVLPQVALGIYFDYMQYLGDKPPEPEALPPPNTVPKEPLFAMMQRLSEQEKFVRERDELIKKYSEGI